jgi:hypothetical protein
MKVADLLRLYEDHFSEDNEDKKKKKKKKNRTVFRLGLLLSYLPRSLIIVFASLVQLVCTSSLMYEFVCLQYFKVAIPFFLFFF